MDGVSLNRKCVFSLGGGGKKSKPELLCRAWGKNLGEHPNLTSLVLREINFSYSLAGQHSVHYQLTRVTVKGEPLGI